MYDHGYQSAAYGYAPGYTEQGGSYYGEDASEGGEGEGFVARMIETVKGYASTVAENMMIPVGIGALAGAWSFFGADAPIVDALSYGLIVAGGVHVAAVLVADGFEAFKSSSLWYGAGLMAVGAVAPMAFDFVEEKTGFGFGNMGYL